jgi:NAD(P)H dehydrogenase (quinone)
MTILVSGASGRLGRLILERLIARGVAASDLIAGARSLGKLEDLRARGIRSVAFDYDDPATLSKGLKGVDRLVLVSVSQPDTPVTQHDAVIRAAAAAEVSALAYTSVYRASESTLPLAPIHAAAERAITATGLPAVILRNNSYTELYLGPVIRARETGVITSAAGGGASPQQRAPTSLRPLPLPSPTTHISVEPLSSRATRHSPTQIWQRQLRKFGSARSRTGRCPRNN